MLRNMGCGMVQMTNKTTLAENILLNETLKDFMLVENN